MARRLTPDLINLIAERFKALAEPARLQILSVLRARELTVSGLVDETGLGQANVSKIERRTDVYISTLRSYVEAMGGELEITAKFPQGEVKIKQFEIIDEKARTPKPPRTRRS